MTETNPNETPEQEPAPDAAGEASSLFIRHLQGLGEGEVPDLDRLREDHPEHADDLRVLHEQWQFVEGGFEATVAFEPAWDAFLDQLRSRGPTHTRYVLKGEIARGGMGVIHQVYDLDGRRPLAMKVILGKEGAPRRKDAPAVDGLSLGRFLDEAQVNCQLDHPGIVPVHEIGLDASDNVYFTMKLVQGEDLAKVFARVHDAEDDGWNQTRALGVLLRVCDAMAYAHDKGVLHRDLKPANVMVGSFGEVYVMDWGLARVLDQEDTKDIRVRDPGVKVRSEFREGGGDSSDLLRTMDGDIVGTPAYMPPEQASGRVDEVTETADVYALGAMLYHLLSGEMPYAELGASRSNLEILEAVKRGAPRSIAEVANEAPSELTAICERAMARQRADRYSGMTALARDLRAFLEDRVVEAYESGAWAELRKWVIRNKALAGTAAAALVAVLILSVWALMERGKAKENEYAARYEAGRADENAELATLRAEEAERERDNVLRLSDARRLERLILEEKDLWPAHPEMIPAMDAWLRRAEALIENLPIHISNLDDLRTGGLLGAPFPRMAKLVAMEAKRAGLLEHLSLHDGENPEDGFDQARTRERHVKAEQAAVDDLNRELPAVRALERTRRELGRNYSFGIDEGASWWHDALRDLVIDLYMFREGEDVAPSLANVERRREKASTLEKRTVTGEGVAQEWLEAQVAIRKHERYGGMELSPQLGLVPLGPDPESGLWEFWHVDSGARPERRALDGRFFITGDTGIVLVLIPGGTYTLGSQSDDREGQNYDPMSFPDEYVHQVILDPFFLSKYEATQGQWERIAGDNPSWWLKVYPEMSGLQFAADNLSWIMCGALRRYGLKLPTESQWEAGCRGGADTPWSFGRDMNLFPDYGNVRDQAYARAVTGEDASSCEQFDDRNVFPTPVGYFRTNGFGLHGVHGNVWEWCEDNYGGLNDPPREGDGLRIREWAAHRVFRGGAYNNRAVETRLAARSHNTPDSASSQLGCRPARSIDP